MKCVTKFSSKLVYKDKDLCMFVLNQPLLQTCARASLLHPCCVTILQSSSVTMGVAGATGLAVSVVIRLFRGTTHVRGTQKVILGVSVLF